MVIKKYLLVFTAASLLLTGRSFAQGGPGGDGPGDDGPGGGPGGGPGEPDNGGPGGPLAAASEPTAVPIDGGAGLLIAAGVGYGIKAFRDKRKAGK